MFVKETATFITAVGTPLDQQNNLVEASFRRHIDHQLENDIDGLLVLGSMGQMACIKHSTYAECARVAVDEVGGRTPIIVGVGDNSVERTIERIDLLKDLNIDGVVVTTPYYFASNQDDLVYYFHAIADMSPFPVYLYDLPLTTKIKIELDTALQLSKHPNILGAKCSHDPIYIRNMAQMTSDCDFEVIHGMYDLVDVFLSYGLRANVDGFYALMPGWTRELKQAYGQQDFETISQRQQKMTHFRNAVIALRIFPAFTVAMNLLGFEGRFHPSHMAPLADSDQGKVRQLLQEAELIS